MADVKLSMPSILPGWILLAPSMKPLAFSINPDRLLPMVGNDADTLSSAPPTKPPTNLPIALPISIRKSPPLLTKSATPGISYKAPTAANTAAIPTISIPAAPIPANADGNSGARPDTSLATTAMAPTANIASVSLSIGTSPSMI